MRRFSSLCLATLVLPEPTLMFRPAVRKNWRGASLYISDFQLSIADLSRSTKVWVGM